jgi:hypothetical protein
LAFSQAASSSGDVALAVLRFPGEAFAHGVDGHEVGEALQHRALAGFPFAFDELDDADLLPWPSARNTMPKAAVLLPLPLPVWTISSPFRWSWWR